MELPLTETESETIEPYYGWEAEFLIKGGIFDADQASAAAPAPDYRMAVLTYQDISRIMEDIWLPGQVSVANY